MKHLIIFICVFTLSILFFGTAYCAEAELLTKSKLAELLVSTTGIKIEADLATMTDAQAYEARVNALAARGVNQLVGKNGNEDVTYAEFVDILFSLLNNPAELDTQEKLQYLVDNGYMPLKDLSAKVTVQEAIEILNPKFAGIVADAYRETATGAPEDISLTAEAIQEEPASEIK